MGIDPSAAMLRVGRAKVSARGLDESITLVEGDAEAIPFPDQSFAGACIAFGIRNVADRARALREMARVTRRGGRGPSYSTWCMIIVREPRKGSSPHSNS